ncbi:MAG: hypothetical protein AB4040_12195 [Synechococcus sp.]
MIVPKINLGERLFQLAAAKNKVNGRSSLRKQLDPTVDLPSVMQACSLQGRFAIQFSPQALSALHICTNQNLLSFLNSRPEFL